MMLVRRLEILLLCLLLCGCGNPGSPLPPSLMLPQPVVDLQASRLGNVVTLRWTMPRRTTDRLLLNGDQRVVACRAVGTGACQEIGQRLLAAGAPAQMEDQLPAELADGPARLLRYELRLENKRKRDAGASNLAFAAAGFAPPAVRTASAAMSPQGIRVRWAAPPNEIETLPGAGARLLVRLERDRVLLPGESERPSSEETRSGVPQPMQQVLEALEHPPAQPGTSWLPDHTLDSAAVLNRSYRYSVQLVEQETLGGHSVEVDGLPTVTDVVVAKDVYPPATPVGLAAVADAEDGSIDLSWSAGIESDIAGYIVYRRIAGAADRPERVSGKDLLPSAAWSDRNVQPAVRYTYSVSAVDTSSNESARSAEVTEALPAKQP